MALFTIIEESPVPPKFIRVRVDLIGESVFFKFDHTPTQDEVDWETIAFLTARENANGITE